MQSRMDKYDNPDEIVALKRTTRNKELYKSYEVDNYNKFDINSNVSVLKENARSIDIDQIKDILDKRYSDNAPKRKSIAIEEEPIRHTEVKEDTKEYDLNSILSKVKEEKSIDYEVERLNKAYSASELVEKINNKYSFKDEEKLKEEEELKTLINTITALELKNKKDAELLDLLDDDKETEIVKESQTSLEDTEEFYTGKLKVKEEDFDDFKDMQKDIKSNSILIKILVFIFIIILLAIALVVINNLLNLGLFNI